MFLYIHIKATEQYFPEVQFIMLYKVSVILGDPGADGGAEDENQNGREKIRKTLGTNSLRTSSKRPNEYSLLIGQTAQSGASIRSAVWNWCVKSLSPGARIFLSYFCSSKIFFPARFDFRLRTHYLSLGLRGWVSVQSDCAF